MQIVSVYKEIIEIAKKLDNDIELEGEALQCLQNVHRKYQFFDQMKECETRRMEIMKIIEERREVESDNDVPSMSQNGLLILVCRFRGCDYS